MAEPVIKTEEFEADSTQLMKGAAKNAAGKRKSDQAKGGSKKVKSESEEPNGLQDKEIKEEIDSEGDEEEEEEEEEEGDGEEEEEEEEEEGDEDEEGELPPQGQATGKEKMATCMQGCSFVGNAADFIKHYKKEHKDFRNVSCKCGKSFNMLAALVYHVYRECYNKD